MQCITPSSAMRKTRGRRVLYSLLSAAIGMISVRSGEGLSLVHFSFFISLFSLPSHPFSFLVSPSTLERRSLST